MIESACIIGAGIGGLATAVALRQRGVRVRVYEQAPELRSFGGALMLWSNAVRVLRALGLEEPALAVGCPLEGMEFRAWDGRLLWTMPVRDTSLRHRAPSLVVPRAAVVDLLARELGDDIQFSARYEQHAEASSGVDVGFEGGLRVSTDLLVGADGARSAIRQRLASRDASYGTGQIVWVGRTFATHPELVPGVPIGTVGRGLRFWAAPVRNGEVWWYAIVQTKHDATTLMDVAQLFARCHDPVPELVRRAEEDSVCHAEILDQAPAFRWSSYRTTLVGDAAHCSRPDVGQGACQALESAVVLAKEVTGEREIGAALREYELRRGPRTAQVGLLARATSFHSVVEHPVLSVLRDVGVATTFPLLAMPALDWLLGGDAA
jgi:2-polyprenyl-6-methoxyphenol hydroxylase-like FAD-dependent oxidoreductase